MKFKKIGMRTIKTAIAVSLTIFLSQIFNLKSPFFAGIAAIIAMQSSVSESFYMGKNRMYSTILGASIGLLFSLIAPENPFFIGIGIIIIIYTCNLFKLKKPISLSTIVFLSIILNYEEGSRISYALHRTLDTFFGLTIGTLINYFIFPPNMKEELIESIENMYLEFRDILEYIVWEEENLSLGGLRKNLITIEENYNILKKDIKLNLFKGHDSFDFEYIFELFESTYNHFSILCSIDKCLYIDENNRQILERLFNKKLPVQIEQKKDNLSLAYNYHLEKILYGLISINNIIHNID